MGRRTKKVANGKIKRYLWDSNVLLHEWEYNAADEPQLLVSPIGEVTFDKEEPIENLTTWVYENGSFVPIGKLTDNESFSIVSDYLGTPVQAYDQSGNLIWERELDIYGRVRKLKGDKDFCNFLYQGQYYDKEIELAYNRFRYYSPETGSYISQDPIGLLGNNPNFYAYVKDTNTWVDIFGLDVYKLIAETDGWYPVFERGKTQPTSYQWLKKDDVYKIGETQDFSKRYDPKDLNKGIINNSNAGAFVNGESIGLKPIFASTGGTKSADLMLEKQLLIDHINTNGELPAGNKICK